MEAFSSHKSKPNEPMIILEIIIGNKLGLHARPAAMFVRAASRFTADIQVHKDQESVNGKSIMGLMMLAAGYGSKIKIIAVGEDAQKAVDELRILIERKFDEE